VGFFPERSRTVAKISLIFAILLVALGLVGYLGTGHQHPTALIPAGFGVLLAIFGWLAISPDEDRRRRFMHVNVTIGLVGLVGTAADIIRNLASSQALNIDAVLAKLVMAWLLLIYITLCVRSFRAARRTEKA
jgi:hypothetical protein